MEDAERPTLPRARRWCGDRPFSLLSALLVPSYVRPLAARAPSRRCAAHRTVGSVRGCVHAPARLYNSTRPTISKTLYPDRISGSRDQDLNAQGQKRTENETPTTWIALDHAGAQHRADAMPSACTGFVRLPIPPTRPPQ